MKRFESRTGRVFGVVGILAALLMLSSTAYGDSKKWRANNNSDQTVKVYWVAAGCAGVKPSCKDKADPIGVVCKTKILQPGESSFYKFKDGTSGREKLACRADGDRSLRELDTTRDRKQNGIRIDGVGAAQWYHD